MAENVEGCVCDGERAAELVCRQHTAQEGHERRPGPRHHRPVPPIRCHRLPDPLRLLPRKVRFYED